MEEFRFSPPSTVAASIGNVVLVVKISPTPLDPEMNGIDVLSHTIWHDTTLADHKGKEQAEYIFGEVDVPILEDKEWKIPPFDNTRNNTLNIQNPAVAVLMGWLSECIDEVRKKIVASDLMPKSCTKSMKGPAAIHRRNWAHSEAVPNRIHCSI